jgi:hypothetical protein
VKPDTPIFLRRTVTRPFLLSPLASHFLKSTAIRLGISGAEFARRIVDAALVEYLKNGLYQLPDEFKDLPFLPLEKPKEYIVPKVPRNKHGSQKKVA